MTNFEMVQILRALKGDIGYKLAQKKMPVKLIIAKNKYINELDKAYQTYEKTLNDLCQTYNVDPNRIEQNKNDDFQRELKDLLEAEAFITLQKVELAIVEQCDTSKYDALSSDEFNILSYLIEE